MIHLLDELAFPILLGKKNPEYIPIDLSPIPQKVINSEVRDLGLNVVSSTILPWKENRSQRKRRMKAEQGSRQSTNIYNKKVRRFGKLSSKITS